MKMKKLIMSKSGISLITLVIMVILILLLAGVTLTAFNASGIISQAEEAIQMSQIEAKRTEIKMSIVRKMEAVQRTITLEEIITQLEKDEIVNVGDSNLTTKQVITQPDGYIYKIEEGNNGNWEVTYVGQ